MQSEPKYTTTDDTGAFSFQNVAVGDHAISIIENGAVLASRKITINTNSNSEDITYSLQPNGDYLVNIPVKLTVISIELVVKDKVLTIGNVKASEPKATASPTKSGNPQTSSSPQTSATPQPSTYPSPSASPQASNPASNPEDTGPTPSIEVCDNYKPSQVWTQMSSVDIFAPRDDNKRVQKIDGKNVIAPGA